jgi:hypothetical protein
LLYRLHERLDRVARHGGTALRMQFVPDLPLARVEPEAAERMLSRLLSATVGFAEEGEMLDSSVALDKQMLCIAIARPRSLRGLEEAQLLDSGFSRPATGPRLLRWASASRLRLVRNLAEGAGGSLTIEPERFELALPGY